MCAKVLPSFTDENRDLQKQIGCMNGIFQLFDRHHFPRRRGISSQNQKRLLPGAHPSMDRRYGVKAEMEKDLAVACKESRASFESSRASCSSSSCSSILSSFDSNKTAQPEAVSFLQNKLFETRKEQTSSFATSQQSLDLRDVVKDSMYRETRSLSIKSKAKDERKGSVLKHIDSPRPCQQSKSGKLQEVTQYKDERLMLHRLSYDERDSRDALKSVIQRKELPRLSLDSRAGTMRRSNFLPRALDMGNDNFTQVSPSNKEPGSNKRTSNVVAKLMGLEVSSHISDCESMPLRIKSCAVLDSISRSPKPAPIGKHTQYSNQDSQKQALKSMKSSAITPSKSSSVYGEIEAMEKTKQRSENRNANPTESSKRLEPATMIMKSAKVIDDIRVASSSPVPRPDTSHLQKLRTRDSAHKRGNSVHKHPGKDFTPKNNLKDPSLHVRPTDKKANWRTSEVQQTSKAPRCIKVESCATCGRSSGGVSPKSKHKKQGIDRQSRLTTPSDSRMMKKQRSKPVVVTGNPNRKVHLKSSNVQHNYDQQGEYTGDTRYSGHQSDTASVMSESNISLMSEIETEVVSLGQSVMMNDKQNQEPIRRNYAVRLRENKITDELATTMPEQPSPVSVLDAAFCRDDSPSPVKKISTAFREDESPTSDDREWHVDNINGLTDQKRFHGNSQRKLDKMDDLVHELRLLNPTTHEESQDQNACMFKSPNWDLQYITKILLASGLLRDVISVPTVIQQRSSYHLINPDLFDVLEQTERNMKLEEDDDENAQSKFNQKIHRQIVFDTVNEILVRKFCSQGAFTLGRKKLIREELPKEVHLELNRLMRKQDSIHDDEDDGFTRLLMVDMKHQSADWTEHTCEISAMVLDIERLIFKDLVTEIVIGEVMGYRVAETVH